MSTQNSKITITGITITLFLILFLSPLFRAQAQTEKKTGIKYGFGYVYHPFIKVIYISSMFCGQEDPEQDINDIDKQWYGCIRSNILPGLNLSENGWSARVSSDELFMKHGYVRKAEYWWSRQDCKDIMESTKEEY